MQAPAHVWVPSIGVSGMLFYTGGAFPEWRGDALVGGLRGQPPGPAAPRSASGGPRGNAASGHRPHPRRSPGPRRADLPGHRRHHPRHRWPAHEDRPNGAGGPAIGARRAGAFSPFDSGARRIRDPGHDHAHIEVLRQDLDKECRARASFRRAEVVEAHTAPGEFTAGRAGPPRNPPTAPPCRRTIRFASPAMDSARGRSGRGRTPPTSRKVIGREARDAVHQAVPRPPPPTWPPRAGSADPRRTDR